MIRFYRDFAICAFVISIPALVHAETMMDHSSIEAGKVHEVCMKLAEGQSMKYSFKSASSMNFNIHYHEGEKVSFPVEEYLTDSADGTFNSTAEHGYCMMWTNPNEAAVELNVEYEIND